MGFSRVRIFLIIFVLFGCSTLPLTKEASAIGSVDEIKMILPVSKLEKFDKKEITIELNEIKCDAFVEDKKITGENHSILMTINCNEWKKEIFNLLSGSEFKKNTSFNLPEFNFPLEPKNISFKFDIKTTVFTSGSKDLLQYWIGDRNVSSEKNIFFSLKELKEIIGKKELEAIAKTSEGKIIYDKCNVKLKFGNDQLNSQKIEFNDTPCAENQFILPFVLHEDETITTNCINDDRLNKSNNFRCLRFKDNDLNFSFKSWKTITFRAVDLNDREEAINIRANKFTPLWSFQHDTESNNAVKESKALEKSCRVEPRYKPVAIHYCPDKTINEKCKRGAIKEFELPDLFSIGWNKETKLPKYFFIDFEMTVENPKFKKKVEKIGPFRFSEKSKKVQEILNGKALKEKLPVVLKEPEIPYDASYNFLIFNDEKSCKGNEKPEIRSLYTARDIGKLKSDVCAFVKVVYGEYDKSFCTQAEQTEGNNAVYSIKSIIRTDKRKLIVIQNSKTLGSDGRGNAIKLALFDWLKEIKEKNNLSYIPVTILVIQEDGSADLILNGEELNNMDIYSDDKKNSRSIKKEIESKITFAGAGFHHLSDLSSVEDFMAKEGWKAEKVFYFTDGKIPEDIRFYQMGTLLGWSLEKVGLHVAIAGECDSWRKKTKVGVKCKPLTDNINKDTVREFINEFVK